MPRFLHEEVASTRYCTTCEAPTLPGCGHDETVWPQLANCDEFVRLPLVPDGAEAPVMHAFPCSKLEGHKGKHRTVVRWDSA